MNILQILKMRIRAVLAKLADPTLSDRTLEKVSVVALVGVEGANSLQWESGKQAGAGNV